MATAFPQVGGDDGGCGNASPVGGGCLGGNSRTSSCHGGGSRRGSGASSDEAGRRRRPSAASAAALAALEEVLLDGYSAPASPELPPPPLPPPPPGGGRRRSLLLPPPPPPPRCSMLSKQAQNPTISVCLLGSPLVCGFRDTRFPRCVEALYASAFRTHRPSNRPSIRYASEHCHIFARFRCVKIFAPHQTK